MLQIYWLITDRYYWDQWDPQNVYEGLFAIANVLSFFRLTLILAADDTLGPLQQSLGKMIKDIVKFMCIFVLFMAAFLIGLHNLYWYYNSDVLRAVHIGNDPNHPINEQVPASKAFATKEDSLRTIFWTLFGMVEPDVVELGSYDNRVTSGIGLLLFTTYNWTMVILLLNMLIAMMSKSFDNVATDQDVEWKYARTTLFLEYIKDFSSLPVPLNIIPSPKSLIRCMTVLVEKFRKHDKNHKYVKEDDTIEAQHDYTSSDSYKKSVTHGIPYSVVVRCKHKDSIRDMNVYRYKDVIAKVAKRFLEQKLNTVSEVSNEELKQDLSSFRYEIINSNKRRQEFASRNSTHFKDIVSLQKDLSMDMTSLQEEIRTLRLDMEKKKCRCSAEEYIGRDLGKTDRDTVNTIRNKDTSTKSVKNQRRTPSYNFKNLKSRFQTQSKYATGNRKSSLPTEMRRIIQKRQNFVDEISTPF